MTSQSQNTSEGSPKVSVIMNCLNCEKYLREAIDSVYSQTYQDWEIIFWDNASTDKSAQIAQSYDGRLRYFKSEETVPLGKARNLAIEQARGEYIAFLDCDDLWFPIKLEKQVNFLDSNKKISLIYSDTHLIDGRGILKRDTFGKKYYRGKIFKQLFNLDFITLLTVMLRREVFDTVGFFNPNYNICEDYDLFLRIANLYIVDYFPESLTKYRIHNGNVSKNLELLAEEELSLIVFWLNKKNRSGKVIEKIALQKKAILYTRLMKYYFKKHEYNKAWKQFRYIIRLPPTAVGKILIYILDGII